MSTCTINSQFSVTDLFAERAARRDTARPRPGAGRETPTGATGPAGSSQILRRWSIAELIAAATWRQEAA